MQKKKAYKKLLKKAKNNDVNAQFELAYE